VGFPVVVGADSKRGKGRVRFSPPEPIYTRSGLQNQTQDNYLEQLFVIKRVAMQLLAEFIGKQKIRLVGVGVSRLRERDERQMLILISKSTVKGIFK